MSNPYKRAADEWLLEIDRIESEGGDPSMAWYLYGDMDAVAALWTGSE